MPRILQAGLWGLVAGSTLLVGAAVGYLTTLPQRLIAAVMAFGGWVLISALSFESWTRPTSGWVHRHRHRVHRWRGHLQCGQPLSGPPRRQAP
jgi:hypothetical protein